MARSNASRPETKGAPGADIETGAGSEQSAADVAALASYISDMAAELAKLAGSSHMPMLAYFLNLSRVEADIQARERGGSPIQRSE